MHLSAVFPLVFCVFTAAAQDAPKPQFTARELFYSAATDSAPPAKPAPKPAAPAPKPATPAPKPAVAVKQPAAQPPVQTATTTPPSQPASQPQAQPAQPMARPDGVKVVKAAMVTAPAPESGTPLGIKYTVLRKVGDDMVQVPSSTVFHSGDRIQFSVQTNGPGYLYIVTRGPSGTWRPMFPSPEVADGNNHVDGWSAHVLPTRRMLFDEQTGTEHVFIVFSRTPEDGLENMIYSLEGPKAKPAADREPDKPETKKHVLSASADIPDSTVGQLRDTYTRDLIIETVDDKTPADKSSSADMGNAVYVVNPSGSADSRVVAEITLEHK